MVTLVPLELLKPHPKNAEFFPDPLPDAIRREMLEDIRENGISTPLILTCDYTILAGHQRWEMARELGLSHVPAIVRDVDPGSPEAVALLIKDNLLRRQLNDMQVARLIRALKEQYGVKRGGDRRSAEAQGSKGQNVLLKIAGEVGIGEKQVARLDKLNDLIPELQSLVASGKLGATAAYSLAFLSPEEQAELLRVLGKAGLAGLSVREAQELRRELEVARREKEELARRLAGLEAREGELERLKARLKELEERPVERVVEKVVYKSDPVLEAELEAVREESARRGRENELLLERVRSMAAEKEKLELRVKELLSKLREAEAREEAARRQLSQKEERNAGGGTEREEFFRLVKRAREAAVELSEAAGLLAGRYGDTLRAVPAASGTDLRGTAEAVEGAATLSLLEAALRLAVARVVHLLEAMEGRKPALKVLKGGGEEGGREKR